MCSNVGSIYIYIYHSRNAMGHIYMIWQEYLFRGYVSNMNVCIPVLVVTLLIALSLYGAYELTVV